MLNPDRAVLSLTECPQAEAQISRISVSVASPGRYRVRSGNWDTLNFAAAAQDCWHFCRLQAEGSGPPWYGFSVATVENPSRNQKLTPICGVAPVPTGPVWTAAEASLGTRSRSACSSLYGVKRAAATEALRSLFVIELVNAD